MSKCDTCFYIHFSRAFYIVFRSAALAIKKLWAILDFFYTLRTFYRPVPDHMHTKIYKKSFNPIPAVVLKNQDTLGGVNLTPPPILNLMFNV